MIKIGNKPNEQGLVYAPYIIVTNSIIVEGDISNTMFFKRTRRINEIKKILSNFR